MNPTHFSTIFSQLPNLTLGTFVAPNESSLSTPPRNFGLVRTAVLNKNLIDHCQLRGQHIANDEESWLHFVLMSL